MNYDCTFNCNGNININDWTLHNKNLVLQNRFEKIIISSKNNESHGFNHSTKQNIFEWVVPSTTGIYELDHFVSCMDMKLKQLCRYEKLNEFTSFENNTDLDFYQLRNSICEFVAYVCNYLDSTKWNNDFIKEANLENGLNELFSIIRRFNRRLYDLPELIYHHAASNRGNQCLHPAYHIYHLHLEMRWLFMAMIYSRHYSQKLTMENEDIDNIIALIINDLIYLALQKFVSRISLTELHLKTPYVCTCNREMWLMLLLFISELNEQGYSKTLWNHMNIAINEIVLQNNSNTVKTFWIEADEKKSLDLKNPEIFSIWLIYHINFLYGFSKDGSYSTLNLTRIESNHDQIEKILKSYFNKCAKGTEIDYVDKELRVIISMIHGLVNECWDPDVKVIKVLLDYFQSNINQRFLLQSFGPWCATYDHKTPIDLLKQVRDRIENTSDQIKESSYGLFLRLIGIFLQKNRDRKEFKFWKQIKGRIYSKFQMSKVQELCDDGLFNFLSLFLTLAICADTIEVCSKIIDIPINVQDSTSSKKVVLIWKVKLAALLLYKDFQYDYKDLKLEEKKDNLLDQISQMSCTPQASSMMKYFVDVLREMLVSSESLDRNVHIFIDGWMDRYLTVCSKNTMVLLIDALCDVCEKCDKMGLQNHPMLDALWKHVASRMRQMVFDTNLDECYLNIAKLAVAFTLQALKNPGTAEKYKHSAVSLFQHFTTSIMIKDVRVIQVYLAKILSHHDAVQCLRQKLTRFDQIVIQAWLKCCILTGDIENEESKFLKHYILCLDSIKEVFTNFSKFQLFRNSDSPLQYFFTALSEKRHALKTEQDIMAFDAKYRTYFQNVDKWALASVTKENIDSELSYRIYKCISMLIFHCGGILHLKNQPQNMLKSIITTAFLPSEDKAYLKQLGKKVFSFVILGIEQLNIKNDLHLQALLQNLFDQYLPLLITNTNTSTTYKVHDTLLNCFTDTEDYSIQLIIEKLANFIVMPSENTTHKNCFLVMLLLQNLTSVGKVISNAVIESIIKICMSPIIGCYMKVHDLHPHKQQTVDLMKSIINNTYYTDSPIIRNNLINILSINMQKYLTIYSQAYFQFLHSLVLIDLQIVLNLVPKIQQIITECEKNRRPNAGSLRYSLSKLMETIQNCRTTIQRKE